MVYYICCEPPKEHTPNVYSSINEQKITRAYILNFSMFHSNIANETDELHKF